MKKIIALLIAPFLLLPSLEARASQALSQLVYEIRDPQTDAPHFRRALESIGEYLALEVLEELHTKEASVETLTGVEATHALVNETPVLITILRAGLPLNTGIQKIFPHSEVGFFAMSRNEETLKANIEYVSLPSIEGKTVIISDTMLATGGSILDAISLVERYAPRKIVVIAAIASQVGIENIQKYNPSIKIITAVIDPSLNEKGYILPGLGDAGDRSYGKKAYTTADCSIPLNTFKEIQ